MMAAQIGIRGGARSWILGGEGTATAKIARAFSPGIIGNAFPKQAKDNEITMLGMNTGASQFDHSGTERLEYVKLKLLLTVITQMRRRVKAGLQSVSADDIGRGQVFNDRWSQTASNASSSTPVA